MDADEAERLLIDIDDPLPVPETRHEKWRPREGLVKPAGPKQYSRVSRSALTFGWPGRAIITTLLLLSLVLVLAMGAFMFISAVALVPVCFIALRDVWKKGRVQ
ncbi:MAG: hypothetical protein ABR548_06930 [Actinomycetota bacterium]|nr:hypothetical protein [Actinomycetota bacterium]